MKPSIRLLIASLALGAATQAHAVVITFEGHSNSIYNAPITRSGFVVGNVAGDEQHFHEITSTNFGLPNNGTGVLLNDRDSRIFVTESAASVFSLVNVDVAAALNNSPAIGLTISGFLNNVLTGTVTINSLGSGYTTLSGAALGNVDRLVFDGFGNGGGFVVDNLNLGGANSNVPDHGATASLLGLAAIAGLGLRRRSVRR